jgi:Restriction endonuclease
MSFSRHGRSFEPIWEEKAGSGIRAHSRPSSASMSLSRISLGGSVSTGARLCFSGQVQNDVMSSCRASLSQRTANRVLTVCLSRGGNPTLLSFQVYFQCKKYKGSVSSSAIRDFRGAMVGRTDKGLFITTGTFTPDAKREATRDGAPPIDLIDGDNLCDLLKSLRLGVSTRMVEDVEIDPEWFTSI